jgi:hypothetical protein
MSAIVCKRGVKQALSGAANARQAPHTNSHGWISAIGAVACLTALAALVWQMARTTPANLWVLVALAVMIEGGYRLTNRELRLHE